VTALAVDDIPEELPLLPFAEFEMRKLPPVARKTYFRRSEYTHVLLDDYNHTLMVVGIYQPTLAHRPELWVLLCAQFKENLRANLRATAQHFQELLRVYPTVVVRVDAEAPLGTKFAEHFGFREYEREDRDGREYIWLRIN
jgi:hypothetical protein